MKLLHDSSTYSIHLTEDEAATLDENWIDVDDQLRICFSDRSAEWWLSHTGRIFYIRIDDPVESMGGFREALTKIEEFLVQS